MSKRLKTTLQFIFFLGLGIFLVWLSMKGLTKDDIAHIKASLQTAKYWLLIPVFAILFLSHLVRAIRWRLLIESLGYRPSTANTFFAVMIGYLANQAFPRLGEVLKCTVLSRYEKVPADKLVGTIILERAVDAISLLVVFAITLIIQPSIYSELMEAIFNSKKEVGAKKISSAILGLIVLAIIVFAILFWMIKNKKSLRDLGWQFKRIGQRIWQGVSAIRHLKRKWLFIFLSVSLWTLYLVGGWIGFSALKETQQYGINEAFTVLSAGSIGMVVTPGGIGGYAFLLQKTMEVYGLNEGIALAFGWILWLAQTTVILIGGLISFVAIPYYNKKLAKRREGLVVNSEGNGLPEAESD